VLQEIQANLTTIYTEIRNVARYHGLLVALTYYSTSYSDPAQVAAPGLCCPGQQGPKMAVGQVVRSARTT
jgi:hypothetical protein